MEKFLDVIRMGVDVSDTMCEGLIHIRNESEKQNYVATLDLLHTLIEGMHAFENEILSNSVLIENSDIDSKSRVFIQSLDVLVRAYEELRYDDIFGLLDKEVVTACEAWNKEVHFRFDTYLKS